MYKQRTETILNSSLIKLDEQLTARGDLALKTSALGPLRLPPGLLAVMFNGDCNLW